jgi:hypothetical protein
MPAVDVEPLSIEAHRARSLEPGDSKRDLTPQKAKLPRSSLRFASMDRSALMRNPAAITNASGSRRIIRFCCWMASRLCHGRISRGRCVGVAPVRGCLAQRIRKGGRPELKRWTYLNSESPVFCSRIWPLPDLFLAFKRKRLANYTADDGESLLALAPANGGQLANSVGLAISPPRQDGA